MIIDQTRVDIATLLSRIRSRELDLQPEFQRGQVWPDAKKVRLIDTILRDWYVPAVHLVVNEELDREEVLDGQQRLQAILDFADGKFAVDGKTLPVDERVRSLDGLFYSQLPNYYRSRFKRFNLDTVRLRDYKPDEPGELFFRLNQITALTAAEQRNALIGKPRNQIKALVNSLEARVGAALIGFSNVRLNYDDTLSRLAVSLEARSLSEKTTAAGLERRYRTEEQFSPFVISLIEESIDLLGDGLRLTHGAVRLNKASLFSWLFFFADVAPSSGDNRKVFSNFIATFEYARGNVRLSHRHLLPDEVLRAAEHLRRDENAKAAADIFNDRATSRVNDTSSILLRDFALNFCFADAHEDILWAVQENRLSVLRDLQDHLINYYVDVEVRLGLEAYLAKEWEAFRARSGN